MKTITSPDVRELPDIEAAQLFDRQARQLTGMSGDEFLKHWRGGEFVDADDDNIMHMLMLLPLVVSLPTTTPPTTGPAMRVGAAIDDWFGKIRRSARRGWVRAWRGRTLAKQ